MFQILVLVPVPLLLLCKIRNKYKHKISNTATNYVYYSTHSWSSCHLNFYIKQPPKSPNADRLNGKALQLNIYWL